MAHVYTRIETSDSVKQGRRILSTLYSEHHRAPETLGLYAKAFYVQYLKSGDQPDTRDGGLLRQSRNYYREGFDNSSDDTYCGINAATKTLLLSEPGSKDDTKAIADEVLRRLPKENLGAYGYWELATIAEAKLIQERVDEAAKDYLRAVDHSPGEQGSHRVTPASVRDLCNVLCLSDADRATLEASFKHL